MKNFIISLTLFISSLSYSAIENPSNIYGYWPNNEFLVPSKSGKFILPVAALEEVLLRWQG